MFKIIAEVSDQNQPKITEATDLITDLGYGSLKFIQLITVIEEAFQIEFDIDDIELEKLRATNCLLKLVEKKIEERKNG
jgi:acyl carrier protein